MGRLGLGLGLGAGRRPPTPVDPGEGTTYNRSSALGLGSAVAASAGRDRVRLATVAETLAITAAGGRDRGRTDAIAQAMAVSATASKETFDPSWLSGLQVWLEPSVSYLWTDLGTTPVVNDTDAIGRWEDRVASYDFDRAATGNRPAYRTSQLSGSGSGRCASFDGTDDYLKSTSWQGVGGAQTIAFRFRLASLPTNRHLYWARTAGGVCDAVYFASSTRINARLGANANGNGRNWSVSLDTTAAHTAVITYDGVSSDSDSSYVCRYDGSALSFAAQSALTLAGTTGTSVVGSYITPTAYFPGFLGPFCVWNRVLNGTEIGQVETYMAGWS